MIDETPVYARRFSVKNPRTCNRKFGASNTLEVMKGKPVSDEDERRPGSRKCVLSSGNGNKTFEKGYISDFVVLCWCGFVPSYQSPKLIKKIEVANI